MPKTLSERALMARLQRSMRHEGIVLRCCREDSRHVQELGRYYAVDSALNAVVQSHLCLESEARNRALLKPWESVG